jgi:3-dehydroquinate dehydratase / shikimate dehydrogenase
MAQICVPVCAPRIEEMRRLAKRAAAAGDLVELRLDYLPERELSQSSEAINEIIKLSERPTILTLRPAEFGGGRAIGIEERLARLEQNWASHPGTLSDLELDLVLVLQERDKEGNDRPGSSVNWDRTICSFHDFAGIPSDIGQLYQRMAATPARILKIAVQADDATNCLAVFCLLERAKQDGREMIGIAMGAAGIMTRILGPSRGSFLTYGSIDDETATAPGQLTARELHKLYRIDQLDSQTQIFGIIGNPVNHSLSPRIHNAAFAAANLNAVYLPLQVHDLVEFMRRMAHPKTRELDWNLRGLSVTAPHKSGVMGQLDWVDPAAQKIGAVNTILVQGDQLLGYNTDAEGFIAPLRATFGSLAGSRCAVIGAGGAARAVLWAIHSDGGKVKVFARNGTKAKELADEYSAECQAIGSESLADFDIVINTTPLGTRGEQQDESPVTAAQLRGVRLAYDLVYNPIETRFLREARQAGCETLSGIGMLLSQAAQQFQLWTGENADTQVMRTAVLTAIEHAD